MNNETLSIVIPAWNEEKTLAQLVEKVVAVELPFQMKKEILIVNDGSSDSTPLIMKQLAEKYSEVHAYNNPQNVGKSQTVRNGLLHSTGAYVVIQDADFEYDPQEIPQLLHVMHDKQLDVVYGNRFGKKNKVIYWQNYIGNKALSLFSNLFTYPRIKTWIPDMEVCYKLIKGDIARSVGDKIVSKSRFGLEPEITARLSRHKESNKNLKFGIVPISYYPRSVAEGKKMNAIHDGYKAFKEIIKFNLQ